MMLTLILISGTALASYEFNSAGYLLIGKSTISSTSFKKLLTSNESLRKFIIVKFQIDPDLLIDKLQDTSKKVNKSDILNTFSISTSSELGAYLKNISEGPTKKNCSLGRIPVPGEAPDKYAALIVPDTTAMTANINLEKDLVAVAFEQKPIQGMWHYKNILWSGEVSDTQYATIDYTTRRTGGPIPQPEPTNRQLFKITGVSAGRTSIQVGAIGSGPIPVHPVYRASITVDVVPQGNGGGNEVARLNVTGRVRVSRREVFDITVNYLDSAGNVLPPRSTSLKWHDPSCFDVVGTGINVFTFRATCGKGKGKRFDFYQTANSKLTGLIYVSVFPNNKKSASKK